MNHDDALPVPDRTPVIPLRRIEPHDRQLPDGRWLGAEWLECPKCHVFIFAFDKKCRGCGREVNHNG